MKKTNAMRILEGLSIEYEVLSYDWDAYIAFDVSLYGKLFSCPFFCPESYCKTPDKSFRHMHRLSRQQVGTAHIPVQAILGKGFSIQVTVKDYSDFSYGFRFLE